MGQVLVLGLIAGGIYGLFALGIVLVYRGSGALNFAQGEIGTLSLYMAWYIITDREYPWLLGAVAAVAFAALVGALFERVVVRTMVEASRLSVAVATVGLLSLILAVEVKYFSESPREVRAPVEGVGTQVFGVFVSPTQMIALVVTIVVALGLAAVLKRTDFGLGILAAAQDPVAVRLVGVPLAKVSTSIWAMGAGVSALGALFIEPTIGVFTPGFASELFLKGLVAAVIGGLTNLPGAFAGGLMVGVIEAASRQYVTTPRGAEYVVMFALVIIVLVARPAGVFAGWAPVTRILNRRSTGDDADIETVVPA